MKIDITKVTSPWLMDAACEFTSGKTRFTLDNKALYHSEHSPIRTQMFWIEMYGIPTFVSVHLVRHKIGVEHYVQSNRNAVADRNTPINHAMLINAGALISMARKRLCHKASLETILVMQEIRKAMRFIDPDLGANLVRECIYRNGHCPEIKSCGHFNIERK